MKLNKRYPNAVIFHRRINVMDYYLNKIARDLPSDLLN